MLYVTRQGTNVGRRRDLHVYQGKLKIKKADNPEYLQARGQSHISEYAAVNLIFLACGGVGDQVTGGINRPIRHHLASLTGSE